MVPVGYESNAEVLLLLQFSRMEDMRADFFDVACCGGYVASLAACAVLDKDKVAEVKG